MKCNQCNLFEPETEYQTPGIIYSLLKQKYIVIFQHLLSIVLDFK